MTSHRKRFMTLVTCTLACLFWAASFAGGAEAGPAWFFNGVELEGNETTVDHSLEGSLSIPGLATTCEPFVFLMTISNSAGTGQGSITKMPLNNCDTNSEACEIETIEAEGLPWNAHLATVGADQYLIVEGVKISVLVLYEGELCVLGGFSILYTGSAGGLIDNETESVTFDAASFTATKTALKAAGSSAQWTGSFTMIATGAHLGDSLTVF